MGIPLMNATEPMQLDTSMPSKIEVLGEIGFLKKHKAAGPDEL